MKDLGGDGSDAQRYHKKPIWRQNRDPSTPAEQSLERHAFLARRDAAQSHDKWDLVRRSAPPARLAVRGEGFTGASSPHFSCRVGDLMVN
jgi:hypothetical protein